MDLMQDLLKLIIIISNKQIFLYCKNIYLYEYQKYNKIRNIIILEKYKNL